MGVCLTPVFDIEIPEAQYDGDGKGLVEHSDALDKIATKQRLTPLSVFLAADLDGDDEFDEFEDDGSKAPSAATEDEWHDCQDGLQTVSGLIQTLESDPSAAKPIRDVHYPLEYLLEELRELERCLAIGAKKQARFHMMLW
jgi:hypothetical protein